MFELKNLTYSVGGKKLFDDLSLTINEGEKVVLLGVNGVGKSSLLRLLNALAFADGGELLFDGVSLDAKKLKDAQFQKEFRRQNGLLFQNIDAMFFNATVYDEIAFGLRQFGMQDIDERVRYWAKQLEIESFLKEVPFRLSGGEKQRVALAAVLCTEPKTLLLDEPTSNMDPRRVGWFVDFLDALKVTTIVTTHNLSLAPELGGRAVVLAGGQPAKVFYDGSPDGLLSNEQLLIEVGLMHTHRHRHGAELHAHYHAHDF